LIHLSFQKEEPMKNHRRIIKVVILGLLFLAAFPTGPGSAAEGVTATVIGLLPVTIVNEIGTTIGGVALMRVKDQSGTANDPSKYVLFQTPASIYRGYRTYTIPATITPASIKSIQVSTNYKGPAKATQRWSWYLYDWLDSSWVLRGDNTGAAANVWKYLMFRTSASPAKFVNATTKQIRLRLVSNNSNGDAKLDYEAIVVCADALGCVRILPSSPVHIAYILPVSGGAQDLGIDARNGAVIAIDDAAGKILNHTIKFDGKDSLCNSGGGLAAATQLAADPSIVAIVGPGCSSETKGGMSVLSAAGLVVVSPSNTLPDLTEPGNPYHFPGYLRVSISDKVQGRLAAQFAWSFLSETKAATIRDGNQISDYQRKDFEAKFIQLGGTISTQKLIDPKATDFSAVLTSIAAGNPDVIYMPVSMPAAGYLVPQARGTTGLETADLIGSDALYTQDLATAAGADVEGFYVTNLDTGLFKPAYKSHFLPAYKAKFGYDPISVWHAHAYDAFNMIKAAIVKVAVVEPDGTIHLGRKVLRDALYATTTFNGLTGNLTCNNLGDCSAANLSMFRYPADPYWPPVPIWPHNQREDGAYRVNIPVNGSLQNPAWSPDGNSILFTRFRKGYNKEPADLFVVEPGSSDTRLLISDGSGNVNLPGSSWNSITHKIVFSSSRDPHDEIYLVDEDGNPGDEVKVTGRANKVAYEPSLSPNGQWVVFESHVLDVEGDGIVVKYKIDGTMPYQNLTNANEDCRQPNWSPAGDKILYQKFSNGQWDIWIMNSDGTNHRKITSGSGEKTDASFSPDGQWIVYSSDELGLEFANLFIKPVSGGNAIRLTYYEGYDGAPSWSYDGKKVAFESFPGDPDNSSGTTLWIIDVQALFQ
jgi:ABC-type branched-subunit amino acid transport system substrate-binding protein/Tol biopolymer transport system component